MIREVTYHQAQCDICGAVNDDGEYSAWSEPDSARMSAIEGGWIELEVRAPENVTGGHIYRVKREGQGPFNERSILFCQEHTGDGISWCSECEEDLDRGKWLMTVRGDFIETACMNLHMNMIRLREARGTDG